MTTESKMTEKKIFNVWYERVKYWGEVSSYTIPRRLEDQPLSNLQLWLVARKISITPAQLEYILIEVLELTTQKRACREQWNYFLRQGIIFKENQHDKSFKLDMIEVRSILKIYDGESEWKKIEAKIKEKRLEDERQIEKWKAEDAESKKAASEAPPSVPDSAKIEVPAAPAAPGGGA